MVYVKDVTHHALKLSHHKISSIVEIERLLLPGFLRNVPVDSLFVVNTLENIQIVQSFGDDRLQCEQHFDLNLVISVVFIVLREITFTFSDSTCETVSIESEILRVVSLSTAEISEITRLLIRSSGPVTLGHHLPGHGQSI